MPQKHVGHFPLGQLPPQLSERANKARVENNRRVISFIKFNSANFY